MLLNVIIHNIDLYQFTQPLVLVVSSLFSLVCTLVIPKIKFELSGHFKTFLAQSQNRPYKMFSALILYAPEVCSLELLLPGEFACKFIAEKLTISSMSGLTENVGGGFKLLCAFSV